jgi:hypothetical protein
MIMAQRNASFSLTKRRANNISMRKDSKMDGNAVSIWIVCCLPSTMGDDYVYPWFLLFPRSLRSIDDIQTLTSGLSPALKNTTRRVEKSNTASSHSKGHKGSHIFI